MKASDYYVVVRMGIQKWSPGGALICSKGTMTYYVVKVGGAVKLRAWPPRRQAQIDLSAVKANWFTWSNLGWE